MISTNSKPALLHLVAPCSTMLSESVVTEWWSEWEVSPEVSGQFRIHVSGCNGHVVWGSICQKWSKVSCQRAEHGLVQLGLNSQTQLQLSFSTTKLKISSSKTHQTHVSKTNECLPNNCSLIFLHNIDNLVLDIFWKIQRGVIWQTCVFVKWSAVFPAIFSKFKFS